MVADHCSAVLISSEYILTAAHCFDDSKISQHKRFIRLQCGSVGNMVNVKPEKVIKNEVFSDTQMHDLALIKIKPIQYTKFLRPVCLTSYEQILENSPVTVIGSGLECKVLKMHTTICFSNNIFLVFHLSGAAKKAEITVRSLKRCTNLYGEWARSKEFVLCAGKAFTGVRRGDSGGPLTAQYQGRHYLIGITSAQTKDVWSGNFRQDENPVLFSRVAPECDSFIGNNSNVKCNKNVIPITASESTETPCGVVSEGRNQGLMKTKNIKTLQPWYCKMLDQSGRHVCSGVLISFQHVLTASECAVDSELTKITIKCGVFFQTASKIAKVRRSENIAVIELDKKIKFEGNVGVVCLPKIDELETTSIETFYINKARETKIIKSLDVTPLEAYNCGSKYARFPPN